MLHREAYYHLNDQAWLESNEDKASLAELIIAKQRNGPTATVKLTWDNLCTRFYDWTDVTPPSGGYATVVSEPASDDPFANDDFSDLAI